MGSEMCIRDSVLAEEPVAGVDGVRVGDLRRSDDPAHVQIAVLAAVSYTHLTLPTSDLV